MVSIGFYWLQNVPAYIQADIINKSQKLFWLEKLEVVIISNDQNSYKKMFRLAIRAARAPVVARTTFATINPVRFYAVAPISREEVTTRAFEALKTVAALQESKLSLEASFQKDLGLDSLDTVEALVALEEEFDLEIPDKISDEIKTVGEAVDYIYEEEQKL